MISSQEIQALFLLAHCQWGSQPDSHLRKLGELAAGRPDTITSEEMWNGQMDKRTENPNYSMILGQCMGFPGRALKASLQNFHPSCSAHIGPLMTFVIAWQRFCEPGQTKNCIFSVYARVCVLSDISISCLQGCNQRAIFVLNHHKLV